MLPRRLPSDRIWRIDECNSDLSLMTKPDIHPRRDPISRLIDALPSGSASVTLTRSDLVALRDANQGGPSVDGDLTVEETASVVGRSTSTVRGWLSQGQLSGYKLNGRDWRVPRTALQRFLNGQGKGHVGADQTIGDLSEWRRVQVVE